MNLIGVQPNMWHFWAALKAELKNVIIQWIFLGKKTEDIHFTYVYSFFPGAAIISVKELLSSSHKKPRCHR